MTKAKMLDRAALVDGIARLTAAEKTLAKGRDALANGRKLLGAAEANLETAKAECVAAKGEHTAAVMRAASTSSDLKPTPRLRTARLREAEAQDEVDAAQAAVAQMEAALAYGERYDGAPNDPAAVAHRELSMIVDDVIRKEADISDLLDSCEQLYAALCDQLEATVYLVRNGLVTSEQLASLDQRLRQRNLPYAILQTSGAGNGEILVTSTSHVEMPSPLTDSWKSARAALHSDPSTPLPRVK